FCPVSKPDVLNVHIIAHTHDDVGWLKTFDQYFYGSETYLANAGVQYILDSVLEQLKLNPERRFIYVESAFFSRWFNNQDPATRLQVTNLVNSGQLEFIGGGWSMNDEAAAHYHDIIDQMTIGLGLLKDLFGDCGVPRVAWQIDPFGHSREQASLFAQMGFDGLFVGRIDYQDKNHRLDLKNMEFFWNASANLKGAGSSLFSGALFNTYSPPTGFCFDLLCSDEPIIVSDKSMEQFVHETENRAESKNHCFVAKKCAQEYKKPNDDKSLPDYNVDKRVFDFYKYVNKQAQYFRTNNIAVTMGNDFNYQQAITWFKNLDKLIKYVNQYDGKEFKRINLFYSTPSCYLKSLNDADITWPTKTDDFFPYASDPHAYWTGYFTSRPALKGNIRRTNNILQVCKQLDALTSSRAGRTTSSADVNHLRKAQGIAQHHDAVTGTAKQAVTDDYARILNDGVVHCENVIDDALKAIKVKDDVHLSRHVFCNKLNVSECHVTEQNDQFVVTVYNPIGRQFLHYLRIPVNGKSYSVTDPKGNEITSQLVPIPMDVVVLPERNSTATQELVFLADIPPLGFATYFVKQTKNFIPKQRSVVRHVDINGKDVVISNKFLELTFDGTNGLLKQMTNLVSKVSQSVKQSFYWYRAMNGDNLTFKRRASGAYIFRPNGTEPNITTEGVSVTLVTGEVVKEVHQTFNDWVSQVVRLYDNSAHVEMEWVVGPIPVERNSRPDWHLNVTEPISGNYYPITNQAYIKDMKSVGAQFSVLTDRSVGVASIDDGSIEIMIHRRLLHDDAFGVSEPLNEPGFDEKGLRVRGKTVVMLNRVKDAMAAQRDIAQRMSLAPLVSFSVTSVTLEQWKNSVNSRDLFTSFSVLSIKETMLAADRTKPVGDFRWKYENNEIPDFRRDEEHRNEEVDNSLSFTLNPMQIRTFIATDAIPGS
uniref:Alpha-mannosidase n=1 Tax=Strigamia maritima TaxID=126957 RepID=T1IVT5_STRMM